MAAAWICEKCGRANQGDLCPGCAEPRPIHIRTWRIGHPEFYKGHYDGVSPVRFTPLALIPLAGLALWGYFFWPLPLLIAAIIAFTLIVGWKYLVALWWLLMRRRRSVSQ